MPRSTVSDADAELLARLASVDRHVSRYQLERWRSRGLLPRPTVLREGFGGTSVEPHPDWVLDAVVLLADSSGRGTPWQWGGIWLFEDELPLSEPCLQQCSSWLVECVQGRIRGLWNAASSGLDARDADPEDERLAIADKVVDRVQRDRRLRPMVQVARAAVLQESPNAGPAELRDLLRRSLTYRVVDIVWPGGLSDSESYVAIAGIEEPNPSLVPLLPSAIASCAATLTTVEATVALAWQEGIESIGGNRIHGLRIQRALMCVVEARVTRGAKDPASAIAFRDLQDMVDETRTFADMASGGVHADQIDIFEILKGEPSDDLLP